MVSNISESNYEESFHIMIVGESVMLGSIFKSFPPSQINIENSFYLNYLNPFFDITDDKQWYMFNLVPIRKMIERGKLEIKNLNLLKTIEGYDVLVIIPEVTPVQILTIPDNK